MFLNQYSYIDCQKLLVFFAGGGKGRRLGYEGQRKGDTRNFAHRIIDFVGDVYVNHKSVSFYSRVDN